MRIGAIAAAAGVTTKTVRFYEHVGLLPEPPRTSNGYRDYPADITARLAFIREAQTAGLTLNEIRDVLAIRDSGHTPCQHVTQLITQHLDHVELRIAQLTQTRAALRKLHSKATATTPADCTSTEICTILTQTSALLDRPAHRDPGH